MSDTKQTFVYATYIHATPEVVYAALTSSAVRPWWFNRLVVGEWKVGNELTQYSNPERNGTDFLAKVLEMDPPKKLVTTFHVAGPGPMHDAGPTRVTYEIIALAHGNVKLIVTHEDLSEALAAGVSKGWPAILAGLKTFLETGKQLDLEMGDQHIAQ